MSKTNYKIGEVVTIIKPQSLFDGLDGKVISVNTDKTLPISVDVDGCGTWSFAFIHLQSKGKEKSSSTIQHGIDIEQKAIKVYSEIQANKPKRTYNKTPKSKIEKRSYTKKDKK